MKLNQSRLIPVMKLNDTKGVTNMLEYSIRSKCNICTNKESDSFVGISCENGDIKLFLPLGFPISDNDKQLQSDILLLLRTLSVTTTKHDSTLADSSISADDHAFPVQAYLFLIADYYNRGYYKERDASLQVAHRGKIDWNRTIKTINPYVSDDEALYLKFVVRKNQKRENELITRIHEYCVYDSFVKMGWLFTAATPPKPSIQFNKRLFKSIVHSKLSHTFNDQNKKLFSNMLAVIEQMCDADAPLSYKFGTNRFEYVWEKMIDMAYGIIGKEQYFPQTMWQLSQEKHNNAFLEPDSIMIWNNNVYVLDAKYYKYGATQKAKDLPESTSINKQITYGEYIAEQEKFKTIHGSSFQVFNAFLMPFDSASQIWKSDTCVLRIGEATSSWKEGKKVYERIQGILIDVRYLMKIYNRASSKEISSLATCIEEAIQSC